MFLSGVCQDKNEPEQPKNEYWRTNLQSAVNKVEELLEKVKNLEDEKIKTASMYGESNGAMERELNEYWRTNLPSAVNKVEELLREVKYIEDEKIKTAFKYGELNGPLERELDKFKGMTVAVFGRAVIDRFNRSIEERLLNKTGTSYTGSRLEDAYIRFLDNNNDPVALDFKKCFKGKTSKDIAKTYRNLYDKISWFTNTYYEALLRLQKFDKLFALFTTMPVKFDDQEKGYLENLIKSFMEDDKEWINYYRPKIELNNVFT